MCSSCFVLISPLKFLLILQMLLQTQIGQQWYVSGAHIPSISCPDLFQYLNYGGVNIGKITLRSIPEGSTVVGVKLSQKVPLSSDYSGKLSLLDGQIKTISNILRGAPVNYRVDFPLSNVLPKLTEISVNGSVLCSAPEYKRPRTNLALKHTLTTSTVSQPLSSSQDTEFDDYPEESEIPQRAERPAKPHKTTADCGRTSVQYTPLIVGGKSAERGLFPWLVAIYDNSPHSLEFRCGGNLISPRSIVTAAHCFNFQGIIKSPEDTLVVVGRYNLLDWSESGSLTKSVKSVIAHPDFRKGAGGSFDADIAVVVLKEAVRYNNMIKPICLWTGRSDDQSIEGSEGVIVGWGQDETGHVTSYPKMVLATVVSETTCIRSKNDFAVLTSNRTLCAGNRDGKGPCSGDSGSGLMLYRNGRWVLRGTVSASLSTKKKKCNLNEYVVYSDVAKFVTWIRRVMV